MRCQKGQISGSIVSIIPSSHLLDSLESHQTLQERSSPSHLSFDTSHQPILRTPPIPRISSLLHSSPLSVAPALPRSAGEQVTPHPARHTGATESCRPHLNPPP